jgi:hypothetical protein
VNRVRLMMWRIKHPSAELRHQQDSANVNIFFILSIRNSLCAVDYHYLQHTEQLPLCHIQRCARAAFLNLFTWRNSLNNFQVSGNPCIKIIISTAHGTLALSVSCRSNNPIIIVNDVLSREWYFSVDLFILANKFKKRCVFCSITISRGTPVEKPCAREFIWMSQLQQDCKLPKITFQRGCETVLVAMFPKKLVVWGYFFCLCICSLFYDAFSVTNTRSI